MISMVIELMEVMSDSGGALACGNWWRTDESCATRKAGGFRRRLTAVAAAPNTRANANVDVVAVVDLVVVGRIKKGRVW